jgi:AcrR family transcriptional regulator
MNVKMSKTGQVLQAAETVFLRYGFARTTMGDIAKAGGVSRPALYLLFEDKEAIFSGVIEQMDKRSLASIKTAISDIDTADERLRYACIAWGAHGIELAEAFTDASDLFDLRFPAVQAVYQRFQTLVVEILSPIAWNLPVSRQDYALTLTYGMRGLLSAARDANHMRSLIEIHVRIYCASIMS